MQRRLLITAGVAILSLTVLALATTGEAAPADDAIIIPKEIKEAVNKMADAVAKGKAIEKEAGVFLNMHPNDFLNTMRIFKPRQQDGAGGLGVGSKPGQYTPDGIEGIIIRYGNPRRKPMSADELKDVAADLTRLADVTLAIADLTYQYAPKKKTPTIDPKDWVKFTDDMKKSAITLKKGIKENKPDDVKKAFTNLYSSCNSCHATFRDAPVAAAKGPVIPEQIQSAIKTMADAIGKGEKIDKNADAFFRENKDDLKKTMWIFQPRQEDGSGGFGIGSKPGLFIPDGIEAFMIQASRLPKPMTEDQLTAAADDLRRLGDVLLAVAEVTQRYKPKNIIIGGPAIARPMDWQASVDKMKQGALDLKTAVKAKRPDGVTKAFTKLSSSCASCHRLFR